MAQGVIASGMANVSGCLWNEGKNDRNQGPIQKGLVCFVEFVFYCIDKGILLNSGILPWSTCVGVCILDQSSGREIVEKNRLNYL